MPLPDKAFRHLPHLRDRISDPATSFFRDLDMDMIDAQLRDLGAPDDWRRPCEAREVLRRDALRGREGQDIWVFAYGSLMWDPAVYFDELRRAHAPQHARCFCLWDEYARGTIDQPGLMAALDTGGGCTGYAFRIPAADVECETFHLCARELIGSAYLPEFVALTTDQGPVEALTFTADHSSENIVTDIPVETQARMIAISAGFLGTGLEYLENLARHLTEMEIDDPYITDLLRRVRAIRDETPA